MLRKFILISLLAVTLPILSFAQTADDYFHGASQSYIHGNYKESKQILADGLNKYPSDPKLNALNSKVKEPPPQDQKSRQKQAQQPQNQQQQKQQPKPQPQKGQINKDDANRMLQALQNKEKENMKKQKERQPQKENAEKDW